MAFSSKSSRRGVLFSSSDEEVDGLDANMVRALAKKPCGLAGPAADGSGEAAEMLSKVTLGFSWA